MELKKLINLLIFILGSVYPTWGQQTNSFCLSSNIDVNKTQSFFGEVVFDPFYYLQELDNLMVQEWFKAQDSLAEIYFSQNPCFKKYSERFKMLHNKRKERISMIRVNELGNYFYLKYDDTSKVDKLYYKQNLSASEIELFDPSVLGEGIDYITYLKPSFDGEKIAIG
ncbi:MAG TPA: hypothetical protein VLN72_04825, partial [Gillisia sp.]|nr:hypothetical protein [Gillisia sp.]